MKKFLACVLAVVLGLSCLTACKPQPAEESQEQTSQLQQAKNYIRALYKDVAAKTAVDYNRVAVVAINGQQYPITWTVEIKAGDPEGVKIVENGNSVTIDVAEAPEEQIDYTLTASVSENGETLSTSFDYYVPGVAKENGGAKVLSEFKTGVGYKYGFYQANLDQTLFFAGCLSGNYLATTQDITKAVDVFIEEVEGGYHLYFMDGETKTYLDIYEYTEGKAGVQLTTEPVATFVWNEDAKVFVAPNVAGEDRYMGTYNTYNTISASSTSYILGDNLSKIGVSQFPCQLLAIEVNTNKVTEFKTGVGYKYGFYQANLDQTLFFAGGLSGNYLATTPDFMKAADVFVEEVEGGYHLYFMDGETKTYLDIYEYTEGKAGVRLTTEPTATFVWNEDACVFVAPAIAGDDRYMGTYNTYNTISSSATSYILGDNLSKIGVSQFPCQLLTVEVPAKAVTPVVGTAYKYGLFQANLNQMLFLSGTMSGNYMATTTNLAEAVDVYIEEVEGGTRIYFMDGETKTYLDIYEYAEGKLGCHLTTEPTAVFTWNEDAKVFVAEVGPETRYLGTYNTYNTISSSNTSYILGDNLSKIGISQFPAMFYVIGF